MSERWPLFAEPWWLDAVAPGCWDEVVVENDHQVVARMPYVTTRRLGHKFLIMPPLTQTLGPWIGPLAGKFATRLSRQHELMATLIEGLPDFDLFRQSFHYTVDNWLPFYWQGFSQTTRYTYTLSDLTDRQALWAGLRSNVRSYIRKAKKALTVREGYDVATLMRLSAMTFAHQSKKVPFDRALVERIVTAGREREQCRILVAEDAAGRAHAALLLVWDEAAAYNLVLGSDPELRNSGAASLAMWRAIELASQVSQVFDFEGSMIQPVEQFFRAFGGRPQPYYQVTKVNSKVIQLAMALAGETSRRAGKRLLGRR